MESPTPKDFPKQDAICDTHGFYQSINVGKRWTSCPSCATDDAKRRKDEADAAWKRERADTRLRHSGLEGRFLEAAFDNFSAKSPEQQRVLQACREYVAKVDFHNGTGLWLIGPPGTGKTHLGSAMVRYIIEERDKDAEIRSGREIVRMLRSTWGNRDRSRTFDGRATTEDQMIEDFGTLGLLVIDEVGVGFGSDSEHVQLFDVIDLRYRLRRPTVLLSNLNAKAMKEAIGDRAYDRLREGATVLPCQWDSHRGTPPTRQPLEAVK